MTRFYASWIVIRTAISMITITTTIIILPEMDEDGEIVVGVVEYTVGIGMTIMIITKLIIFSQFIHTHSKHSIYKPINPCIIN